jgi:hypothetical protein
MMGITPSHASQDDWSDGDAEDIDEDSDSDADEDMGEDVGDTYITAKEAIKFTVEDYESYKKYPAILRTNKHIYNEAISMFHEEAILVLEPGDIFCLRNPKDLEFGAPHENVWRHNPLEGWKDVNGAAKYDTPELEGGLIDPHVFARFQRVFFDANFDFEHTQSIEFWIDDATHKVKPDDAAEYQKILRKSAVIKDFIQVLQRSKLTSLEVSLEVEVMANSDLMMEEMLDESDDEADDVEEKIDTLMEVANERATELFLDSGICDLLKTLTNVQSFDFNFGFEHREDEKMYKPQPKHVKWIEQVKKTIENNWTA